MQQHELLPIIEQVLQGNTNAFEKIYTAHVQQIYRFCFYRLQHQLDAEEVTADTFVKAYQQLARYAPHKAHFKTWLYAIARNTLIDHERRSRQVDSLDQHEEVAAAYSVSVHNETLDAKAEVALLLLGLQPAERQLLQLRFTEELSNREISLILGKSEGSIKMAISRALATLRSKTPNSHR